MAIFSLGDSLLLVSILLHLFLCPFTKVEESFNMQAMNDLLTFGSEIQHYDHLLFPGVVPRTFCGALIVSLMSYLPSRALDFSDSSPIFNLYLCRGMLAILVWISFVHVRQAITKKFGTRVSFFFCLLLSLQFHVPFYSSRSLPNTFALIFANHSFASWLKVSVHLSCSTRLRDFSIVITCDRALSSWNCNGDLPLRYVDPSRPIGTGDAVLSRGDTTILHSLTPLSLTHR
jgi:glucan phosphoethanolaminetransferase (alkaline phosphatase superfamily)